MRTVRAELSKLQDEAKGQQNQAQLLAEQAAAKADKVCTLVLPYLAWPCLALACLVFFSIFDLSRLVLSLRVQSSVLTDVAFAFDPYLLSTNSHGKKEVQLYLNKSIQSCSVKKKWTQVFYSYYSTILTPQHIIFTTVLRSTNSEVHYRQTWIVLTG